MRTSTIFFIIGLMVLARAEVNVFAQIESTEFGQTLLNLVQMNMQSNAQAEMKSEESQNSIGDLLSDIQTSILKNLEVAVAFDHDFQEDAAREIAQFGRIASEQANRISATAAAIASDQAALAANNADLARATAHSKDVQGQIDAADASNAASLEKNSLVSSQVSEAVQSCKDANGELSKLDYGVLAEGQSINMAQIKAGMEKIQLALSAHLPNRLTIYKPIISALVDMGSKSDPALVKKVQGLIAQLRGALEGELVLLAKSEKVRVANHAQLRADLVNDARNTQERIGRDLSVARSLKRNVAQSLQVNALLKVALADSTQLLANKRAEVVVENTNLANGKATVASQVQLLGTLLGHVRTQFGGEFKNYLVNRQLQGF